MWPARLARRALRVRADGARLPTAPAGGCGRCCAGAAAAAAGEAAAAGRRAFSTVGALRVTAAHDAVTVALESGGESFSATVECGPAASGRGAAEAEAAAATLSSVLEGMEVAEQGALDEELEEMRGAELAEVDRNVSAGLVAATSMAACLAGAAARQLPLYHHIAEVAARPTEQFVLPIPFMAVLSGGPRAANALPIQDILACPNAAITFAEGHELASELLAVLGNTLEEIDGIAPAPTAVGSWAPHDVDTDAAMRLAYEAIQDAGLEDRLTLGLNVAPSSGLFTGDDGYDLYDLNYKDPEAPDETRAESLCYLFQKLSER